MLNLLSQFVALGLLLGGIWLGYRRWIKPRAHQLGRSAQGLLLLVVVTFLGGFIGSPFWWIDLSASFSWDLPPLASRMLASAGWTFALVSFFALQQPTPARLQLVNWLIFIYLAPLVVAILLFHLDRFDFTVPLTYAFFVIAVSMSLASLWYLLWPPALALETRPERPAPPWSKIYLGLVALVTGLWGLALFLTDNGPISWLWVWPGDLLSSRLIAVMLLAIATGSLFSSRHAEARPLMLTGIAAYGVGLFLAGLWQGAIGKPIPIGYVVIFGVLALGAIILLRRVPGSYSEPKATP